MKRTFERDYVDHGPPNSAEYMINDSSEKRRKMARIEYDNNPHHQSNYSPRPPVNNRGHPMANNSNYYDDGYSRNRFYPHNYISQQQPPPSSSSSSSSRRGDYYSPNRYAPTNGTPGRDFETDNSKRRLPSPPPPPSTQQNYNQQSLYAESSNIEENTSEKPSTTSHETKPSISQLEETTTGSTTIQTTTSSGSVKVQEEQKKQQIDAELTQSEVTQKELDNAMSVDETKSGENQSTDKRYNQQQQQQIQPENDHTSPLSREQVLKEIHNVDESISDINAKLVVAKAKPAPEKEDVVEPESDKTIKNKNKIQQIYFENRKKCQDAASVFHFLLPDSMVQDDSINPLQHVNMSELPQVKETMSTFALIADELEKNILSSWEAAHSRNLQLAEQYRSLKRKWTMEQEKKRRKKRIANEDSDDEEEDVGQYKKLTAVCPPMLSEEERQLEMRTRNGYVEPATVYREQKEQRLYESAWTDEERKIFMQKFAQYPKNCKKIATFLPNKTTYDCVNYYYNHKLTPEFVKLKEKLKNKKKYMKRVYDEGPGTRNRTSIMEPESPGVDEIETRSRRAATANAKPRRTNNSAAAAEEEWNDIESAKFLSLLEEHGRNFTAIAQGMKGKSATQCQKFFNSNKRKLNLDSYLPASRARSTGNRQPASAAGRPQTRRTTANQIAEQPVTPVEDAAPALAKKTKKQVSIWTNSEKDAFLELLLEVGKNWKHISDHIPSKTENQIKNFFQNYKVKLGIATPPGMKRAKKKKRASIVVEPPAELCKLAEIAQQVQEKGATSVHDLHSLLCDESSIPLNTRNNALLTNSTPPPPPSLSTVNPNTDMKRYAISSVPMMSNVELLAIAALQDSSTRMTKEGQIPSHPVSYPPKPLSEPTPVPKKTTKTTNPRRSRSNSNAGVSSANRTPRKTDAAATGAVRSQPQQHSPPQVQQHHQPKYLQNYNSMYGVPPHNLLNLPSLQPMAGPHMEDHQIPTEVSTTKRTPVKKQQTQRPQGQLPQHTHVQQPWFSPFPNLLNQRQDIPSHDVNAFGAVPPPPPSIDLTSSESLSTSYGSQKPQATMSRQHISGPTGNNTAPPAMTNLPPFHAFSTVLSQLPAMPETVNNTGSTITNGQEKKSEGRNVMDQLAQPFTTFPSATPIKQDHTMNVVSAPSQPTVTQPRVDNRVSFQDLDGGRVPDFIGGFKSNQTQSSDWNSAGATEHHQSSTTSTHAPPPAQSNLLSFPSNSIFSTVGNPSVATNNTSAGNAFSTSAFTIPNTQPATGNNPYPDHQTLFAMLQQTPPQATAYRGVPSQSSPAFSHSATPPLVSNSSLYSHTTPSPPPLPFLPGLSPRVTDVTSARQVNK